MFQKIQDAWAVLRDADLRRKYDAEKLASDIKAFKGSRLIPYFEKQGIDPQIRHM